MVGQKSILPYEPWDQRNYLWVEGNLTPIYQNFKKARKNEKIYMKLNMDC